ncbi:MAG: hypothetical protein JNL02_11120 [Saprospiraceae bacterium]|nr:hypothetical protein [Saprospiraceae bacterium]
MKTLVINLFLCLFLIGKSFGQQNILENASFETDQTGCGQVPTDWYDCSDSPVNNSPVDIQPGCYGVYKPAADGYNYLSMVVRDDGTKESIGQFLPENLLKDSFYILTISVCRSEVFLGYSKLIGKEIQLSTPVVLNIWGGNQSCDHKQLLARTELVTQMDWTQYEFDLLPETDISEFIIEACFNESSRIYYNGNILIDNIILTKIP